MRLFLPLPGSVGPHASCSRSFSEIGQRRSFHQFPDDLLFDSLPPKVHGAGVGIGASIAPEKTPVKEIRPLDRHKNLLYFDLLRSPGQGVAADRPPGRRDDPAPGKLLKDLCQKTLGNPSRGSYVP